MDTTKAKKAPSRFAIHRRFIALMLLLGIISLAAAGGYVAGCCVAPPAEVERYIGNVTGTQKDFSTYTFPKGGYNLPCVAQVSIPLMHVFDRASSSSNYFMRSQMGVMPLTSYSGPEEFEGRIHLEEGAFVVVEQVSIPDSRYSAMAKIQFFYRTGEPTNFDSMWVEWKDLQRVLEMNNGCPPRY